jgi:hypothetical protein
VSKLSLTKPEVGKPDSTEDVKIVNALTAIEAWANTLVEGGAGIPESQLGKAVQELLNNKTAGGVSKKSIIPAEQSRENTAFGTMATPDEVEIVLPENGLLMVAFQGAWAETVKGAARAALFIGEHQLKGATGASGVPLGQEAINNAPIGTQVQPLFTTPSGLVGDVHSAGWADVTTGQLIGELVSGEDEGSRRAGVCTIFAAAGTYKISVQFKASEGKVAVKNRKLWAWVIA